MKSLAEINRQSNEAARRAAEENQQPYVPFNRTEIDTYPPFPFPLLGSHCPDGWEQIEDLFVDSSGVGRPWEPAMTTAKLKAKIEEFFEEDSSLGYGVTSYGQFQLNLGVFKRTKNTEQGQQLGLDKTKMDDEHVLRDLDLDGYRLQLWDLESKDLDHRTKVAYRLTLPSGGVLFEGEIGVSQYSVIDSDEVVRSILAFISLRPGDVEKEYFGGYTEEQMDWAETEAESFSVWSLDPTCTGCEGESCDACGGSGLYGSPPVFSEEGEPPSVFKPWGFNK